MATFVNARVSNLQESATLAVMAKAQQLKAQGKSIVDLSTGEPDMDTPEHIKEAAMKALRDGKTKYTPAAGIPALREALAKKFQEQNGITASAATVIVTNGGKQALHEVFDVVLEPGDEVVIPAPYWVSFPAMVDLSGGKSVIVQTRPENGYRLTAADLERAITSRTKALVFNSPSNPTGVGYSADDIRAIGAVLEKHSRVLVIADEVYERVTYDGFEFNSVAKVLPQLADRIVTVNAFSKTYSMTGWRVGYATGPKDIIAAMIKHQSQTTSNVCSMAQHAALAALQGDQSSVARMVESFDRRMGRVISAINAGELPGISLAGKPQGAFYLFLRMSDDLYRRAGSSAGLAELLLDSSGVAVVPGAAFGDDRAVRISVGAADEQIEAFIRRTGEGLRALK